MSLLCRESGRLTLIMLSTSLCFIFTQMLELCLHTHFRTMTSTPQVQDLAETAGHVVCEHMYLQHYVCVWLLSYKCALDKSWHSGEGVCCFPTDHHRWERHLSNHNSSYQGNALSVPGSQFQSLQISTIAVSYGALCCWGCLIFFPGFSSLSLFISSFLSFRILLPIPPLSPRFNAMSTQTCTVYLHKPTIMITYMYL